MSTQPALVYSAKGKPPNCSICCAEVGEEHDTWCNGEGVVTQPTCAKCNRPIEPAGWPSWRHIGRAGHGNHAAELRREETVA